ncbi:MAG: hypothetical protein Q7S12_02330 [bacterium]|nr:hypothetical protein [bacterium]
MNTLQIRDRIFPSVFVQADGEEAKARPVHREELPKLKIIHGAKREFAKPKAGTLGFGIFKDCGGACSLERTSANLKETFVLPPEIASDCEERENWLTNLFFNGLDECREISKMDSDAKESLFAAAKDLLARIGMEIDAGSMMAASRWILDCVEESNYGDHMEENGEELYPRLRDFANGFPKTFKLFRKAMQSAGIIFPG